MPVGIYKRTKKHNLHISEAQKALGELHWTKRPDVRKKKSLSAKKFFANGGVNAMKGKHLSAEHKEKAVATRRANGTYRLMTAEERLKKREYQPKGENHYNWKGGLTSINTQIRNSLEYKLWRKEIMERDDYRCYDCGQRGGSLEVDHIYPFSLFPRLRLTPENARTLCVECHRKTKTFAGKIRNFVLT